MTSVGELKFEVVTNNRTFIFKAESEGVNMSYVQICMHVASHVFVLAILLNMFIHTCVLEIHSVRRNNWVTALQECTRGRHLLNTLNPGLPLTTDYQGYLDLRGLRHKLYKFYTVVASDKVFLYKTMEVRTLCV